MQMTTVLLATFSVLWYWRKFFDHKAYKHLRRKYRLSYF